MRRSTFIMLMIITNILGAFGPSSAQTAPDLGSAAEYVLYTSAGEFANTGPTAITGDIGNGTGAVTGDEVTVIGNKHFGDSQGLANAIAVSSAYAQLANSTSNPCEYNLPSSIGAGIVLIPGVYCSATATSLTGELVLDGKGVTDAKFIIKIDGALSVNAPVNIKLTGGTLIKNVYWQVNGVFNLDENALFKGTVINNGAVNLAIGASISGRVLSTAGKISLNSNNISNSEVSLPASLVTFMVKGENNSVVLNWATTSEINSDRFEIEHSTLGKLWEKIASVDSRGESRVLVSYSFTHATPEDGNNLYRLKMIDKDETFAYSRIRNINIESQNTMSLYPNPASAFVTLDVKNLSEIQRVEFNDGSGKPLIDIKRSIFSNIHSDFNISAFPSGMYTVRVTYMNGHVETGKIVKR